jgi:hypothetical protein
MALELDNIWRYKLKATPGDKTAPRFKRFKE